MPTDAAAARAARILAARPFLHTARPEQVSPPGPWHVWLVLAGRGWGKTRCGAEWVHDQALSGVSRIALVGATAADVRDTMIEGPSGILATAPVGARPLYEPSKRRLTWPSGVQATAYSADEPDRLRGPQHGACWADELAAWRYADDTWAMLMMGLRMGQAPRCLVTTTPRPIRIVRDLLKDPSTHVTRGSTYDNAAHLAPTFLAEIERRYAGTRLGRQELHAEILDDTPGALWTRDQIEASRVREVPALKRLVVAVDPAVTAGEDSDETGIVVAGLGTDGHGYVLDDKSCRLSPQGWAARAVIAYHASKADRLIAEVNNGGDLVETIVRSIDRAVSYRAVHAARGKLTRAEPIAALYEQGKVHHIGALPELEDQMCSYVPGQPSPDRMDALVWALTDLMLDHSGVGYAGANTRTMQ